MPDDYLKLPEAEIKMRKEALETYKLQQEIIDSTKKSWFQQSAAKMPTYSLLVGILVSLVGVFFNLGIDDEFGAFIWL